MRLEADQQLRVRRRPLHQFVHQSQRMRAHAHHAIVDGSARAVTMLMIMMLIMAVGLWV